MSPEHNLFLKALLTSPVWDAIKQNETEAVNMILLVFYIVVLGILLHYVAGNNMKIGSLVPEIEADEHFFFLQTIENKGNFLFCLAISQNQYL